MAEAAAAECRAILQLGSLTFQKKGGKKSKSKNKNTIKNKINDQNNRMAPYFEYGIPRPPRLLLLPLLPPPPPPPILPKLLLLTLLTLPSADDRTEGELLEGDKPPAGDSNDGDSNGVDGRRMMPEPAIKFPDMRLDRCCRRARWFGSVDPGVLDALDVPGSGVLIDRVGGWEGEGCEEEET